MGGISTAPSGSTLTLMYLGGGSCRCYWTQPVDGVEWTTDGNIPHEYSPSGGERTLVVCPSGKFFEDNTRCAGDSFDNIPSQNSCFTKCSQTQGCKAYSWRAATENCHVCDSSDRTSDSVTIRITPPTELPSLPFATACLVAMVHMGSGDG